MFKDFDYEGIRQGVIAHDQVDLLVRKPFAMLDVALMQPVDKMGEYFKKDFQM